MLFYNIWWNRSQIKYTLGDASVRQCPNHVYGERFHGIFFVVCGNFLRNFQEICQETARDDRAEILDHEKSPRDSRKGRRPAPRRRRKARKAAESTTSRADLFHRWWNSRKGPGRESRPQSCPRTPRKRCRPAPRHRSKARRPWELEPSHANRPIPCRNKWRRSGRNSCTTRSRRPTKEKMPSTKTS